MISQSIIVINQKNIYFVKPTTQSFPYFLIPNPNRQQIHQKEGKGSVKIIRGELLLYEVPL